MNKKTLAEYIQSIRSNYPAVFAGLRSKVAALYAEAEKFVEPSAHGRPLLK